MKQTIIYIAIVAAFSAIAGHANAITLPIKTKVDKEYMVDGKQVSKAEALMASVNGKKVVVCDQYQAQVTASGSITLGKATK